MARPRIVVVGGGSQFSIGLCESFIDYGRDDLAGSDVVLLDIKPEHVGVVQDFSSRLAAATAVDMTFTATTDRREAFEGADYILTTFRPGSHAQLIEDETIPPKHGLQGNETVGIGGIFMACRVAPVMQQICADAQEICPDAWLVNYTNPTQFVADIVRRVSDLKVISLCDGFLDIASDLSMFLGVDPAEIKFRVAGTNHAMWATELRIGGRDGYELLRERLEGIDEEELERMFAPSSPIQMFDLDFEYDEIYKQFIEHYGFPFSLKLFKLFGLLPGPRYYWRYLLDQDAIIEAQRSGNYVTMGGFYTQHAEPRAFRDIEERLQRSTKELATTRREGGGGHGDLAVRVISAIINDTGEDFVVNVPNRGAVSNLPEDAVLELSASVDATGPHAYAVGPLPEPLVGLQQGLVRSQQLAVTAALSGSRRDLLRAIVAHPLVHSVPAAEACMDELLRLQARYLPQFATARELAETTAA